MIKYKEIFMRVLVQRVKSAKITINGESQSMGVGLIAYVGYGSGDTDRNEWLANKLCGLRVFEEDEKMNLSILDVGGTLMLVSNFTLCGNVQKGFRPSFDGALAYKEAEGQFYDLVDKCSERVPVVSGVFGADMLIECGVDGPVNIIIE